MSRLKHVMSERGLMMSGLTHMKRKAMDVKSSGEKRGYLELGLKSKSAEHESVLSIDAPKSAMLNGTVEDLRELEGCEEFSKENGSFFCILIIQNGFLDLHTVFLKGFLL